MNLYELKLAVSSNEYDDKISRIYGAKELDNTKKRYEEAIDGFKEFFGYEEGEFYIFSSPGRTELCGNHTDHNYGKVLAGAVNIDVIGVVCKNGGDTVRVKSKGHSVNEITLGELEPISGEEGSSNAILRGTVSRIKDMGYKVGGFDAYTVSSVPAGSGLSSSAAYECLLGYITSNLFNNDAITNVELAKISQYAENVFFGKPCGLMDQLTVATGSAVKFDFKNIDNPSIERLEYDFQNSGYSLCIVNTGGSHADLTEDYAAVRKEMESVAAAFGKSVLREVNKEDVIAKMGELRSTVGDRALLRAMHYYGENERVENAAACLKNGDFKGFLACIKDSGFSSYMYNQNVYSSKKPDEQGISLALNIAESVLKEDGAYRVHGGGFAGTIQAFVPNDKLDEFKEKIEAVFGEDNCYILSIRPCGPARII